MSCSFRTVVYKGLAAADRLADFYGDLADPRWEANFIIFHQRFSTNTLPTWERAQPFRTLCHNGEINAIQGNENRMRARAVLGTVEAGLGPEELFRPLLDPRTPTSGKLDAAVELLTMGGRDIRHAVAMLMPDAWESLHDMDPGVRGFYSLPLGAGGAVGRPGRPRVHRRHRRGRRARPQRPAPHALDVVGGRHRRVLLGGGRGRPHRVTARCAGDGSDRGR